MECNKLQKLLGLAEPGKIHQFPVFENDFCLTDVVLNLYTYDSGPNGLNTSKGSCDIWLVDPAANTSTWLFKCLVEKYGHQIHLTSGILCPKGSYLTANAGVFTEGNSQIVKVTMTGYQC